MAWKRGRLDGLRGKPAAGKLRCSGPTDDGLLWGKLRCSGPGNAAVVAGGSGTAAALDHHMQHRAGEAPTLGFFRFRDSAAA